jgi:hypothetical protein
LTPCPPIARKISAATPGRSGTPRSATFATSGSWAIPRITTCSIDSPFAMRVPSFQLKLERTWTGTPNRRAISTERLWSTLAPNDASSSISSYESALSFRAPGTTRGSAV